MCFPSTNEALVFAKAQLDNFYQFFTNGEQWASVLKWPRLIDEQFESFINDVGLKNAASYCQFVSHVEENRAYINSQLALYEKQRGPLVESSITTAMAGGFFNQGYCGEAAASYLNFIYTHHEKLGAFIIYEGNDKSMHAFCLLNHKPGEFSQLTQEQCSLRALASISPGCIIVDPLLGKCFQITELDLEFSDYLETYLGVGYQCSQIVDFSTPQGQLGIRSVITQAKQLHTSAKFLIEQKKQLFLLTQSFGTLLSAVKQVNPKYEKQVNAYFPKQARLLKMLVAYISGSADWTVDLYARKFTLESENLAGLKSIRAKMWQHAIPKEKLKLLKLTYNNESPERVAYRLELTGFDFQDGKQLQDVEAVLPAAENNSVALGPVQ